MIGQRDGLPFAQDAGHDVLARRAVCWLIMRKTLCAGWPRTSLSGQPVSDWATGLRKVI